MKRNAALHYFVLKAAPYLVGTDFIVRACRDLVVQPTSELQETSELTSYTVNGSSADNVHDGILWK